jgi:DNA-binding response OmpR family regulator
MPKINKTVLIVEDEPSLRQALVDKFTRENFNVQSAENGTHGLTIAQNTHIDCILLDILMPEMSGIEMLKALRKLTEYQQTPVIMLSNLNDTEQVSEALALGAHDYLVKSSWKLEDVVNKVKTKLNI